MLGPVILCPIRLSATAALLSRLVLGASRCVVVISCLHCMRAVPGVASKFLPAIWIWRYRWRDTSLRSRTQISLFGCFFVLWLAAPPLFRAHAFFSCLSRTQLLNIFSSYDRKPHLDFGLGHDIFRCFSSGGLRILSLFRFLFRSK